jgi:PAS domain S-box-containing protein
MAAATFIPDDGIVTDITSGISEFTLVVSIAAASTLILTLFLASVIADRRIEAINEREAIRLRDSEERFRRLFDDAAVAMFVMDVNGQINSANRAMSDLLGMSPKELIGAKGPSFVHPDDLDFFAADLAEAKDGSIAVKSVERRFVRTDGQIVWGIASRAVVPDFAKGAMSIFCQIQDVTEQRKSERERTNLEAQLRQTQKLEAIGQLAAGIAHEINTPIQYIGDNLRFVERSFPDISRLITAYRELVKAAKSDRKLRDCIESVEAALSEPELEYLLNEIPSSMNQSIDGVEQVTRIVTAMREFSHPGQHLKALADINRAIKNTVTVSRNEWKESAEMEMSFDPDLGLVNCVVGELNQAFLNLVVNAAQAVAAAGRGPDGRIRVSTRQEGPWAIIRIADNGAGIPAEFHDRVFEPFFTTKEIGKGTGQGLSIAYEIIVNRHGGEIEFSSEPGAGTEFVIRLPAEDSEIASEAA